MVTITIREKVIALLFTEWVNSTRGYHIGTDFEKLKYFEVMILPNMIENGSFDATVDYLLEQNKKQYDKRSM